jgi:citrate lyase subunit beta/citryl-CoA lyase
VTLRIERQSAEAGRRGQDVRSDCWAKITPADSGGIDLDLKSKVESMYGESTRQLVRDELDALGVRNARVEIEDAGALPFVILARVETAVRRLGIDVGEGFLPDCASGTDYATERDRFRRSRLYLPGNEPKFMLNAGLHKPDAVILDLEDGVAPAEKDAARVLVRNALRCVNFHGAERMVRINQGERGLEDLDFVATHNVHVLLIPKVESPEQVKQVDKKLRKLLSGSRIDRPVYLMPIVESALGAIRAYEIATASDNIVALTIGLEDYTADIGVARTKEGRESFWARSQVVNAARAAGVQPIDSVFSDVADTEGLRESVLEAKSLGFDGKGCIHPRQIAVIHQAFAPTEAELARARRIVAAFEEAERKGLGVVSLGSKMIDPPVVKRALRIVRLANVTNLLE